MFTADQHFTIEVKHGITRCLPKSNEVASAFKTLQFVCQKLAPHVPGAGSASISLDGMIGPSTTLVVQMIAMRFCEGKHQALAPLVSMQPEEAIPFVAANAMEIAGYIDQVVTGDPMALVAPQPIEERPPDPVEMLKGVLTPSRIVAAGVGLLGIAGLAIAAAMSDRRSLGTMDRSHLLPESDGSDEFDEDAYEADDDDGSPAAEEPQHAA